MMELVIWAGIFIISLFFLVKSADYFTTASEKIGRAFGISPFIIGVTMVAIGTSLPELVTSIIAVINHSPEIVSGNVVGSNITNIFLIGGLSAILGKRLTIKHKLLHVDLPFLAASAFLLALTMYDGIFTFTEGVLSLAGMVIYLAYTITSEGSRSSAKKSPQKNAAERPKKLYAVYLTFVVSAVVIYFGAKFTVDSVIKLSELLDVGTEIIAVSAVALGTSLPELMVSITSAIKGKPEIAVGNIIGSNVFNSLAVMGVPALFSSIPIPSEILTFSLPLMLIATLYYYFIIHKREIMYWEGLMLFLFYIFFIGKIFGFF